MADKSVGELIAATNVTPTDLFVLEQNGAAKKLTGQVLENWLVSFADGHGGIHSIVKESTSGLVDTYRITLADTTYFDFLVTNGRSITSVKQTSVSGLTRTYTINFNDGGTETFTVTDGRAITEIVKTSTSGLVDIYTISLNDGTSKTFTVTNGAKGDKGDNQYVWIKYASQKPTASSHSFGDVADDWIGIYSGASETAPTDWTQYEWFQIKGEKGETGAAATLISSVVEYQVSDSGTIIPSGAWSASVPVVAQGKYLWTRTTNNFNTGSPVASYSVSRMGLDGSGSVSSVANISPDEHGNVPLTASDVGALPNTGGDLNGELKMNGQPISGLNAPTANDQAANMEFVNQQIEKSVLRKNQLDNWYFGNPVNQRGVESGAGWNQGYGLDRWRALYNNAVNWNSDGYLEMPSGVINCIVEQYFEKDFGNEQVTVSVLCKDGTLYSDTVNWGWEVHLFIGTVFEGSRVGLVDGKHTFRLCRQPDYDAEIKIVAVKLELGSTQTLARQVNGAWVLNEIPDFAAEFAECSRYYHHIGNARMTGCAVNGLGLVVPITVPTKMRQDIIASAVTVGPAQIFNDNGVWDNVSFYIVDYDGGGTYRLIANQPANTTIGHAYLVMGIDALSADL